MSDVTGRLGRVYVCVLFRKQVIEACVCRRLLLHVETRRLMWAAWPCRVGCKVHMVLAASAFMYNRALHAPAA